MDDNLHHKLAHKARPVEFLRTKGLFAATTVGVGSLMGAGLYVLVGLAAAEAGPALWIAYVVCGGLTFLSVLMFGEFARRVPLSGGGYIYAYQQLGAFWGFMVGWHLAVGSVFACALYAVGFASYAASLFVGTDVASPWLLRGLAVALVAALTLLAARGGRGGDRVQGVLTWGNVLVLLLLVAVALPVMQGSHFTPHFPMGLGGVGSAISIIYISFFGYQLIANNAEEVRDAPQTVPRAMLLSIGIAGGIYLLVAVAAVAAVDWQALAASEAPLVLVAMRALGDAGVVVVAIGGVLAAGAALNGTLVSQGRQIFAMGRDGLLPETLGTVRPSNQIPLAALLAGGGATVAVVVAADLAFIAKAANFALLFSMLPLSFALHRLNQQREDGDPVASVWRRALPWAALVANAALLFTLDGQSLLFGGTIVGAGCVVFLSYSYSAEKRSQAGFSVSLTEERSAPLLQRGDRILVPMANPQTCDALFAISRALMPPGGGEIVAVSIVLTDEAEQPRAALLHEGRTAEALSIIERASALAAASRVTLRPVVRAAKNLAEGIRHAAEEEHCNLIVMGWSRGDAASPSKVLEDVIARVRASLILLRLSSDEPPVRIGVSLGGRANLPLMVRTANTLAEQNDGEVTYLNVMPAIVENEHLRHARQIQIEALLRHTSLVPYRTELLRSDNPLGALVERSRDLDMLLVGTTQAGLYQRATVGSFSAMVAEQAHCSVVIVRQTQTLGRRLTPSLIPIR